MKHLRWLTLLASITAGCDSITDVGKPLTVSLTASKTIAAVGESIDFRAEATGRSLVGIELHYGDDNTDLQTTFGAQSAAAQFSHAYENAGVYEVIAVAVDHNGQNVTRSLDVTINAAGGAGVNGPAAFAARLDREGSPRMRRRPEAHGLDL